MEIRIERLTEDNFNSHSLDNFIRHQVVTECLRNVDGKWILLPISFVEEWSLDKCREEASAIANNLYGDMIDYGAFEETDLILLKLEERKPERSFADYGHKGNAKKCAD